VTHTYAILDVSPTTYAEIRALLERAGYQHAFDEVDGQQVIDLHGIALRIHAHEPVDG
jgi:DNA-directed RNA polymerase subunit F